MLAAAAAVLAVGFAVVLAYARRQTRSKLIQAASTRAAPSATRCPAPCSPSACSFRSPALDNHIDGADALAVRRLDRASAVGHGLRHRARLHDPLSRRLARRGGGRLEQGLAQYRRCGAHARRDRQRDAASRCICRCCRPALGAAALLVFVDSMKELPATLLLRPFNFDTLATQVFTLVSLYRYEEAGLSALTIVLVSLAPVLLLHGIIAGSRPGASTNQREAAPTGPKWALPDLLISQQNATRWARYLGLNRARKTGSYGQSKTGEAVLFGPAPGTGGRDGMKPRQIPWKWLLLGLITLLIVGLAVMPRLIADFDAALLPRHRRLIGLDRRRGQAHRAVARALLPRCLDQERLRADQRLAPAAGEIRSAPRTPRSRSISPS